MKTTSNFLATLIFLISVGSYSLRNNYISQLSTLYEVQESIENYEDFLWVSKNIYEAQRDTNFRGFIDYLYPVGISDLLFDIRKSNPIYASKLQSQYYSFLDLIEPLSSAPQTIVSLNDSNKINIPQIKQFPSQGYLTQCLEYSVQDTSFKDYLLKHGLKWANFYSTKDLIKEMYSVSSIRFKYRNAMSITNSDYTLNSKIEDFISTMPNDNLEIESHITNELNWLDQYNLSVDQRFKEIEYSGINVISVKNYIETSNYIIIILILIYFVVTLYEIKFTKTINTTSLTIPYFLLHIELKYGNKILSVLIEVVSRFITIIFYTVVSIALLKLNVIWPMLTKHEFYNWFLHYDLLNENEKSKFMVISSIIIVGATIVFFTVIEYQIKKAQVVTKIKYLGFSKKAKVSIGFIIALLLVASIIFNSKIANLKNNENKNNPISAIINYNGSIYLSNTRVFNENREENFNSYLSKYRSIKGRDIKTVNLQEVNIKFNLTVGLLLLLIILLFFAFIHNLKGISGFLLASIIHILIMQFQVFVVFLR